MFTQDRGGALVVQRERRGRQSAWYQYLQTIPELVKYQPVTKLALAIVLYALGNTSQWAIESAGRVAVTSGDYLFLFTSWQGLLLIVMGLAVLFLLYTWVSRPRALRRP